MNKVPFFEASFPAPFIGDAKYFLGEEELTPRLLCNYEIIEKTGSLFCSSTALGTDVKFLNKIRILQFAFRLIGAKNFGNSSILHFCSF